MTKQRSLSTDFTMSPDNGKNVLTSNHSKMEEFVLVGEPHEMEVKDQTAGFVVVGPGSIEGSAPLSPTDKKLYYGRA